MRPSAPRLVRVLRKSALQGNPAVLRRIVPEPVRSDVRQPTLIEILQQRQLQAGAEYPKNIRIEPVVTKATFRDVAPDIREELKKLTKER
ncbi:hypothetical protein K474DRAFT_1657747 [Panus rudis PR-1116 ss-1]|nr:hypothetical protein K474DRAFT_1657747 [Panus rudis PR-1116 ss-1]